MQLNKGTTLAERKGVGGGGAVEEAGAGRTSAKGFALTEAGLHNTAAHNSTSSEASPPAPEHGTVLSRTPPRTPPRSPRGRIGQMRPVAGHASHGGANGFLARVAPVAVLFAAALLLLGSLYSNTRSELKVSRETYEQVSYFRTTGTREYAYRELPLASSLPILLHWRLQNMRASFSHSPQLGCSFMSAEASEPELRAAIG